MSSLIKKIATMAFILTVLATPAALRADHRGGHGGGDFRNDNFRHDYHHDYDRNYYGGGIGIGADTPDLYYQPYSQYYYDEPSPGVGMDVGGQGVYFDMR